VEQHASSLAMKLQLLAQELAVSLEQVSSPLFSLRLPCFTLSSLLSLIQANEQAIRNMPRVVHDLDFLHKDAAALRETLGTIHRGLEANQRKTDTSLRSLGEIDSVKGRMEDRQALPPPPPFLQHPKPSRDLISPV